MRTAIFLLTMRGLVGSAEAQAPKTLPPTPPSAGAGRGGFTGPSISVRPLDDRFARTAAGTLLGWRVGVRTDAFGSLAFWDAAAKADAAGLAFVEGVSTQVVGSEIPKKLDYNLAPDEVAKVKVRLNELRLRMPAYYAESMPADPGSRRKLFEFAKGLGADMIVAPVEPASLARWTSWPTSWR
jgi:hypothetical protein